MKTIMCHMLRYPNFGRDKGETISDDMTIKTKRDQTVMMRLLSFQLPLEVIKKDSNIENYDV